MSFALSSRDSAPRNKPSLLKGLRTDFQTCTYGVEQCAKT